MPRAETRRDIARGTHPSIIKLNGMDHLAALVGIELRLYPVNKIPKEQVECVTRGEATEVSVFIQEGHTIDMRVLKANETE